MMEEKKRKTPSDEYSILEPGTPPPMSTQRALHINRPAYPAQIGKRDFAQQRAGSLFAGPRFAISHTVNQPSHPNDRKATSAMRQGENALVVLDEPLRALMQCLFERGELPLADLAEKLGVGSGFTELSICFGRVELPGSRLAIRRNNRGSE